MKTTNNSNGSSEEHEMSDIVAQTLPAVFNLGDLDGSNGFRIEGVAAGDTLGYSVSGVGDINNDGFDDVIVGAPFADPNGTSSGSSYVVFGMASGFSASLNLADLDGSNGFRLDGVATEDFSGRVVSGAGDVNGDGVDDLIIGAPSADPNGQSSGSSYVVFGQQGGFSATFSLASLDGSNGFRIDGNVATISAGFAVSGAGNVNGDVDINGDGIGDLIIGAPSASNPIQSSGSSYVVFGMTSGHTATFNLGTLDGNNGFRVDGEGIADNSGAFVSRAGDINNDGIDDILIGAHSADPLGAASNSGAAYVVFGKATGFAADLDLDALDGSNGFRIDGAAVEDFAGREVRSAGDVNGDTFDDLIIGASSTDNNGSASGSSYIVYGKNGGFAATISLAAINGINGSRLDGLAAGDNLGWSVNGAGDVNNDGIDDLIVGAYGADPNGATSGSAYIVYGRSGGFGATFDLASLDGTNGYRLDGVAAGDNAGWTVSAAGDVNGDGRGDVIIGAYGADPNGNGSGASYVVFGVHLNRDPAGAVVIVGNTFEGETLTATNTLTDEDGLGPFKYQWFADGIAIDGADLDIYTLGPVDLDKAITVRIRYTDGGGTLESVTSDPTSPVLEGQEIIYVADLDGGNGFSIHGAATADNSGHSVSRAGDVNGDGFGDLIIGAPYTDQIGSNSGSSYVVFGKSDFTGVIQLADLEDGGDGFRIDGLAEDDNAGYSVSGAGDINNDGYDDILVGARWADSNGVNSGSSYVVFGRSSFANFTGIADLDGSNGFQLHGTSQGSEFGYSVSDAGDVNGDGFDDLIVGARFDDHNATSSGTSYVVFGKASGFSAIFDLTNLDGSDGFRLDGVATANVSGFSVSGAGDVNGDGYDDLIIGAPSASPDGVKSGASYVVFGKANGFTPSVDLVDLDGSNGFRLDGVAADEDAGHSVSNAGDINGDGYDDLIIGAIFANPDGTQSGASYVVFGKAGGFAPALDLADLDGSDGFRLDGNELDDRTGFSVSGAGDINRDGYDDLIIGAPFADANGNNSGAAYVLYGRADGFEATFKLANLTRARGLILYGETGRLGISVSDAGDVNGDGVDDLIVGATQVDISSGRSYVLFGTNTNSTPTGEVLISGEAIEDETLTATNTLADLDGVGMISYQWYANGIEIVGATSATYTLTENEVGKTISVAASYTDDFGINESVPSSATETVVAAILGLLIEGGPGPDNLEGGAGNDTILGYDGRDVLRGLGGDDQLIGGDDIDNVLYSGQLVDYSIVNQSGQLTVSGPEADGIDTLSGIERVHFIDVSIAFDLTGNAGKVVKLLGAMLGANDWNNKEYIGVGLDFFDNSGYSYEEIMDIALEVVLGPNPTNEQVVSLLFNNVAGGPPSQSDLNDFVGLLNSGVYTQASLAVAAAEYPLNADNIGLVGLALTGVEYFA